MKRNTIESLFNGVLGEILPYKSDHIFVESMNVIKDSKIQPDILINQPDLPPVIIESSKDAKDAERDAQARLNKQTKDNTPIQCVIAVHIPEIFHDKDTKTMRELLRTVQLKYCIYKPHRVPNKGWIEGTAYDIAGFIRSTSITKLDEIVNDIESMLKLASERLPKSKKLIKELHQREWELTANSVVILWLNTLIIQDHLHKTNKGKRFKVDYINNKKQITVITDNSKCDNIFEIKPIHNIYNTMLPDSRYYYQAWSDIYNINWKSIFKKSIDALDECIKNDYRDTCKVFDILQKIIYKIQSTRYDKLVNIGAELFPKMSVDRKSAAAFYTNDTTAEFLANLTITESNIDKDIFERIKIVDMACGTGTLLRAGYDVIKQQYEKIHGIDEKSMKQIHCDAIKKGLVGTDIFTISTHLTASSLTMMGYGDFYDNINIGMMPVGGSIGSTGSLEFLADDMNYDLLMTNQKIKGTSTDTNEYDQIVIKNNSIDYILMNPPYSKTRGGQSTFDITGMDDISRNKCQKRWSELLDKISDKPIAMQSAGMAASFLVLASLKLKPGGRLGFVLPLTMAFGDSWSVTRNYITRNFEDVVAITIAGGYDNQQLSADTNMNEMLLIATKSEKPHEPSLIKCITLDTNFEYGIATELARTVQSTIQKVDDNTPTYPILFGDDNIGNCTLFKTNGNESWSTLGTTNNNISQFVINLKKGTIDTNNQKHIINMKTVSDVFKLGPIQDLIGYTLGSISSGLFEFHPINNELPSTSSIWHVTSNIQYTMLSKPTHKGILVKNDPKELKKITDQNSILFITHGYRWTSQKLTSTVTEKPMMGGRSWTGIIHKDNDILKTACLWFNSIFGMMLYWSHGSKSVPGRITNSINTLRNLSCPDFTTLPKNKILQASKKLDELKNKYLMPGSRMHLDTVRHEIDQTIIDLFDWDISNQELTDLRNQLVNEPSIFTGQQTNLDPDEKIIDSICQDIVLDGIKEPITMILTNKNIIIFNPNMTKLNDQVIKIPYNNIKHILLDKSTIQFTLYDRPRDKKSKRYWNGIFGYIDNLPSKHLKSIHKQIKSNIL